jgi:hypothetical protein
LTSNHGYSYHIKTCKLQKENEMRKLLHEKELQEREKNIVLQEQKLKEKEIKKEKDSIKIGYNYLVQEREHVNSNQPIYKFGMTVQEPDNHIYRIRNGYKKGSKILLLISCDEDQAKIRENKIKSEFIKKFERHTDGNEHFIGDYKEMIRIISNICID